MLLAPFGDGERIAAFVALCPNERASNASLWHSCLVHAKDADMRDFRDAKAMAHTLRAALAAKGLKITNSRSLELIAEAFGVADWNTLAATIRGEALVARKNASRPPLWPTESNPVIPFSAAFDGTMRRALVDTTQVGCCRLAHPIVPISGKPEIGGGIRAARYSALRAIQPRRRLSAKRQAPKQEPRANEHEERPPRDQSR